MKTFPTDSRASARRRAALAPLLLLAAFSFIGDASAFMPLGPVGNVALPNPNSIEPENDAFGVATAAGDFNDDGIDDLAVSDRQHPNLVRIYYGIAWDIGDTVTSPFMMDTVPVPTVPGSTPGPNIALAVGDFGHDASDDDDLVVGVPGDSLSADKAGAVFVLDRAANGSWSVIDTIRQGAGGYPGISEANDHFGAALAVGSFDQNDAVDLAIGIPGETTGGLANAGVVMIVGQGVGGLSGDLTEVFYRGNNGLSGVPAADEQFGSALAAGDFNGDEVDDLAVGIPGTTCAGFAAAGSVMVLLGQDNLDGLDAAGVTYWNQAHAGVLGSCEANDRFGSALAAGRFDAVTFGETSTVDLAIGVPGEAVDGVVLAGAVSILFGSDQGITADANLLLHEGNLPGGTLQPAAFGARLAAGRINQAAGSNDSLVIGAPLASENGMTFAGHAWVIFSRAGELYVDGASRLALTPAYVAGPPGAGDGFGSQFAIGDFNGDGDRDLAIGIPGSSLGADGAGAVQVIYQSRFIFVDGFD